MEDRCLQDIFDSRFARLLLDAMAEGVFTLDVQGRITSWNPSMEKLTGYSAGEAIGQTCKTLKFTRCLNRTCPENINECTIYSRGSVESAECQMRHRDGHIVPVIKNARVVKDELGDDIGVVETVTDISELMDVRRQVEEAALKLAETHQFENIIGKSAVMRRVFDSVRAAAKSDATVLIQGESGTGKELVAGAIHFHSDRSRGPLIPVNCSALSESILESELFGHVRGAFTGAHRDRKGRFEESHGGTIFLDEIGEISPYIQLKLLRAIQERQIERVGDSNSMDLDFRVIAATNKDLYGLVRQGLFREDLYYRLKVFPIHMPPLMARKDDIPLLATHFVNRFNRKTGRRIKGVAKDAMRLLMAHAWPGNVRELENAIEHAFVLCEEEIIKAAALPVEIRKIPAAPLLGHGPVVTGGIRAGSPNRTDLLELLDACGWNKAEVGRRLGISRTSVWKYMKKHDIPLKRPD